jgi:endonuclease YncB( thermonuclease family)
MNFRVAFVASAALVAAAAVSLLLTDPTPSARAEPVEHLRGRDEPSQTRNIRVIDGDTLEDMSTDITYRIENIDTPETGSRARCTAERELGNRATSAVRALVQSASDFEIHPSGRIDRYERAIALVFVDGHDLGETLIAEGLARPWRGRREPWCDASGNLIP